MTSAASQPDPNRVAWSPAVERAVLSVVLDGRHAEAWPTVREHSAGPQAFHHRDHRLLALVIDHVAASGQPVNASTVAAAAGQMRFSTALEALHGKQDARAMLKAAQGEIDRDDSVLAAVGGFEAVAELAGAYGPVTALAQNAKTLDAYHRQRRVIETLDELSARARAVDGTPNLHRIIDEASTRLCDIAANGQTTGSIADGAKRALARHDEVAARAGDDQAATWGVDVLDEGCRLTRNRFVIVAARPGCGKTSMGLQAAEATRNKLGGDAVAIVSYEMGDDELAEILCGRRIGVGRQTIMRGWLSTEKRAEFAAEIAKWEANNIVVKGQSGNANIDGVVAWIRSLFRRRAGRLHLVVVDYLGLIPGTDPKHTTNDRIGEVTRKLKMIAYELRICVVCLCQLKRVDAKEKRTPELSDLRDSGNIEQDADGVVFIWPSAPDQDDRPVVQVNARVAKNRLGPIRTYGLEFLKAYGQRFREIGGDRPSRGERAYGQPDPSEDVLGQQPPTPQQEP